MIMTLTALDGNAGLSVHGVTDARFPISGLMLVSESHHLLVERIKRLLARFYGGWGASEMQAGDREVPALAGAAVHLNTGLGMSLAFDTNSRSKRYF